MRTLSVTAVAMVALTGCGAGYEDYYPNRQDPTIASIEPAFELGNAGGQVVSIQGSGFGVDATDVMVLIDNHNAEIVSVSDTELRVVTPEGPITGGPVDVLVATAKGYSLVDDRAEGFPLYEYGTADFSGREGGFYTGQEHYVQVTNVYNSCYGGIGAPVGGCQNSSFNGQTGISGSAEFLRFSYPRLHSTNIGWLTGFDAAIGSWRIDDPSPVFANGIDDLRVRLPQGLTIKNPAFAGEWTCVDLVAGPAAGTGVDCTPSNRTRRYELDTMQWCEQQDVTDGGTYEYSPDWPVDHDFFQPDEGALPDDPVPVQLNIPDLGLANKAVTLPPPVDLESEAGFDVTNLPWAISPTTRCNDTNGDGAATLDEDGMILTWTPIVQPEEDIESVLLGAEAVNSYVHVSFSSVDFTWYGLETIGVRASTVVQDSNELWEDEFGTMKSRLRIPNEVLYQLPTPNLSWTEEPMGLGEPGKLGTFASNARYLFMEVYRVTDYRIQTDEGPLVFSYSTGELTLLQDWDNPMTRSRDCLDCIDGDGDGWVDELDPDCDDDLEFGGDGRSELTRTTPYTCNDGLDNNGDGRIDAADPLCTAGWDGESSCGDGLDNDGDTWIDELDPDCIGGDAFTQEDGSKTGGTCNDGLDNDGDGWIDAGDPNCVDGLGDEVGGFGTTACNDGIDQDNHEDPDHLDVYCILNGALTNTEVAARFSGCSNNRDDDSDGFIDALDPDCEYRPYNAERDRFHDPADETKAIVGECYDGIDNDGNGIKDREEPACWNPAYGFAPDGFLSSETTDRGTDCTSGADEDGDGWIDGLDPDCQPGSADTQVEVGFGTTECNNGIDDDGDGLTDSDDERCTRGSQNYEGPR